MEEMIALLAIIGFVTITLLALSFLIDMGDSKKDEDG